MRFFVLACPYMNNHAGNRVLYELQKLIIRRGHDCIIVPIGSTVNPNIVEDDDIAIYPEIIVGNPLNAKRVVRYLLNIPGVIGGDGKYEPADYLLAFNKRHAYLSKGKYLAIPSFEGFFRDYKKKRTANSFWVGKEVKKKRIDLPGNPIEITYAWPSKRKQLADLLNRSDFFFTYDFLSGINYEAKLCGCKVKYINDSGEVVDCDFSESDEMLAAMQENFERFMQDMEQW